MFLLAVPFCMAVMVTLESLLVSDIVIGTYKFYLVWYLKITTLNKLSRTTQLVCSRAQIQTQISLTLKPITFLLNYTELTCLTNAERTSFFFVYMFITSYKWWETPVFVAIVTQKIVPGWMNESSNISSPESGRPSLNLPREMLYF